MAYIYHRSLTIDHTQVANTDQINFPVLVSINNTTFKTVANGGHINNTVTQSGGNPVTMPADMIFTSDAGGSLLIPWEIESYDPTTGVLWVWVQIADVSTSVDTVFYTYYGDASVTTQQNTGSFSPANVWDSNFAAVYHFPDGTTLNSKDSTSNAINLTNTGTAIAGQIDGAVTFNGLSQVAQNTSATSLSGSFPLTIETWINNTNPSSSYEIFVQGYRYGSTPTALGIFKTPSNELWYFGDAMVRATTATIASGVWVHTVFVFNSSSSVTAYINGVNVSIDQPIALTINAKEIYLGALDGTNYYLFGSLDEVRYSNSIRSADWIATEYNNQSLPNVFLALGSEMTSVTTKYNTRLSLLGVGI